MGFLQFVAVFVIASALVWSEPGEGALLGWLLPGAALAAAVWLLGPGMSLVVAIGTLAWWQMDVTSSAWVPSVGWPLVLAGSVIAAPFQAWRNGWLHGGGTDAGSLGSGGDWSSGGGDCGGGGDGD